MSSIEQPNTSTGKSELLPTTFMDKFLRAHETIKEEASDDSKCESSSWKPSSECDSDQGKEKSSVDSPLSVLKEP